MTPKRGWSDPRRGSASERGYGWAWRKLAWQIRVRDNHCCVLCWAAGRPVPCTCVDHVRPKSQGDSDEPGNLRSLCHACHDKVSLEQRGHTQRTAFNRDGKPTDPAHPWYRGR